MAANQCKYRNILVDSILKEMKTTNLLCISDADNESFRVSEIFQIDDPKRDLYPVPASEDSFERFCTSCAREYASKIDAYVLQFIYLVYGKNVKTGDGTHISSFDIGKLTVDKLLQLENSAHVERSNEMCVHMPYIFWRLLMRSPDSHIKRNVHEEYHIGVGPERRFFGVEVATNYNAIDNDASNIVVAKKHVVPFSLVVNEIRGVYMGNNASQHLVNATVCATLGDFPEDKVHSLMINKCF